MQIKKINIEIRQAFKSGDIDQRMLMREKYDDSLVSEIADKVFKAQDRLDSYKRSPRFRHKIREYCNRSLGTDCIPYEVVRIVNERCVDIRRMDTKIITSPKKFHTGGFAAIVEDNDNQSYEYMSNETYTPVRIYLSKTGWGKGTYIMSDQPVKFHDYNF